jgi:hypothetical protein
MIKIFLGDFMKLLKYALIIPIIYGCNSKNNSIEVLKTNAQSYINASNTVAANSTDEIVYFNIDNNTLNINLIEKSNQDELSITECKVNKVTYTPTKIDSADIGKHYTINLANSKKKLKIECRLSNDKVIKKSLTRYWK